MYTLYHIIAQSVCFSEWHLRVDDTDWQARLSSQEEGKALPPGSHVPALKIPQASQTFTPPKPCERAGLHTLMTSASVKIQESINVSLGAQSFEL